MLQSNLEKQPTKVEMQKKVEAWKTINSVLVSANAEFMGKLNQMLKQKSEELTKLEEKLKSNEGTEDDNAEYLFTGGYVQCLKDILYAKKGSQNK